ncbi:MAG TPA: mechanosensitive ion channel, partial [bacterium]|nr:mechanosensitive ion channel [bacterium]
NKAIQKAEEIKQNEEETRARLEDAARKLDEASSSGDRETATDIQQTAAGALEQVKNLDDAVSEIQEIKENSGTSDHEAQRGTGGKPAGQVSESSGVTPVDSQKLAEKASELEETAAAIAQIQETEKASKINLLDRVTRLREERTLLLDNLRAVIDELETKTDKKDDATLAEIKDYRRYISTVSGIHVDVTDTTSAWVTFKGWAMSSQGGKRWFFNIVSFVAILLFAWFVSGILGHLSNKAMSNTRLPLLLKDFLTKSIRWVVMIIGFIWALSALEVSIGPLLALVGAAGFILAFAMQDSLSNFACGLMILFFRPFDTGDAVEAGGVSGTVQTMNLVSTTIKTFDNKLMVVPNSKIWSDVITNITGVTQRRVDMVFGIGYGDDIDKAQEILEKIVTSHPKVLKDPAPVVKVAALADSSVNFICRPWTTPADYWDVYWDVTREVKMQFDAEGVGIPFPQQDVHLYVEHRADKDIEPRDNSAMTRHTEQPPAPEGPHDDGGLDTPDEK